MHSTEYLFVNYIVYACNERDQGMVLSLTYSGAMDTLRSAGTVTSQIEYESEFDDDDDCDE